MNINEVQKLVENDGIIFLSYGGFLSQELISSMTEALEKEAEANDVGMGVSSNIFTIFIELSQNMMNYSKSIDLESDDIVPGGLIIVSKDEEGNYYINSQNIVSIDDKIKMMPKLHEVTTLDRDGIKKRYKELRKSGKNSHEKGGGIGFYEIAKRCNEIKYTFTKINENKFYFHMKTKINIKK
ncbi:MAG: SiaB family protein kinase [Campylobacterota bacterium]|nr:SiaB family protein kinase [Campylobacterota bacterium]